MKTIELMDKYPLSTEVIREWFFKELVKSIDIAEDVPEEFKQAMLKEGVSNERLAILIDAQPRTLFDVFDENDIIIVIGHHENFGFNYAVCEDNDQQQYFKNRKEAEHASIEVAFEILEDQLTTIDLPEVKE